MSSTTRRILFVAHAADRSGPPRALLPLAQRIADQPGVSIETAVLRGGGELLNDFWALGPVWELDDDEFDDDETTARRRSRDLTARWAHLEGFDLVFLNTAWSARALRFLPPALRATVAHVHELDLGFGHVLPGPDRARLLERADRFIVGCDAVASMLRDRFDVPPGRITLHRYPLVEPPRHATADAEALRRRLAIPEDALVVGTVAVTEWRKGPDLWCEVARRLRETSRGRPIHFVWVGGPTRGQPDLRPTQEEVDSLGIAAYAHFVGHQTDLWGWYTLFDVFALTSREDAYPLACIEAAALGVPTVCFDTGGMVEFAGTGAGAVAHYPRVDEFAAVLRGLLDHDGDLRAAGEVARATVAEWHDAERCVDALADEVLHLAGP